MAHSPVRPVAARTALPSFDALTATTAPATSANLEGEELFQLIKRTDVNPHEVEEVGSHAVEVSVLWKTSILHVGHLASTKDFALTTREAKKLPASSALFGGLGAGTSIIATGAATGSFVVGAIGTVVALAGAGAGIALDGRNTQQARDTSRYVVGAEVLGERDEMPVVLNSAGATRFVFAPGASGEVEIDGAKVALAALIADGRAQASTTIDGAHEIEMRPNTRYRMELGGLTVQARVVAPGRRVAGLAIRRDPARLWAGVGAMAAVAAVVGSALFASADDGMMTQGNDEDRLAELRAFVTRQHESQPAAQPQPTEVTQNGGTQGAAAAGPAGAMGSRTAPQRAAHYTIADRHITPQLGRQQIETRVRTAGVFGGLPGAVMAYNGPTGPFGEVGSGYDSEDHRGHMTGGPGGDAFGYDGLGTVGTGVGNGGDGQGTIGVGPLGTIGNSDRAGISGTVGTHLTRREGHPPHLNPGHPETDGGLPAEAIRRVVLHNLPQVSFCHEQGLQANPQLAGRVVVRFVIGSNGTVLASAVSESSVSVPSVSSCIASAVRRWTFPTPTNGGTATVTYPFNLQPAQ